MMTAQISKADQIRELLHLSNAEIAKRIGCRDAYVRTVRQRTSANGNPIETPSGASWKAANRDLLRSRWRERYHSDPELRRRYYAANYAWKKEQYRTNPEYREKLLSYQSAWRRKRRAEARAS